MHFVISRVVVALLTLTALLSPAAVSTHGSARVSVTSDASPLASAVAWTQVSGSGRWVWPLMPVPVVVRPFDAPEAAWSAGHRGVDLLGRQGQPVLSIGGGVVSFTGAVAGRGVVVVRHGALRSTYEPVTASLSVGTQVSSGEVIGLLQSVRSHCLPAVCLHLGVRRGDKYLDPLSLLGPRAVRLKPLPRDGSSMRPADSLGQPPLSTRARAPSVTDAQAWTSPPTAERAPSTLAVALGLVAGLTGWGVASATRRRQARG